MLLAMFNADSPLMATLDLDRELHWVHQYQLIEKTRFGAYVVGVLIFTGFFLNDGNVFVSGIFWALAAALLYLLRHIRTLVLSARRAVTEGKCLTTGTRRLRGRVAATH